jgi:hypothetical protein
VVNARTPRCGRGGRPGGAAVRQRRGLIEDSGLGFVGSLPPSNHPDLLAIPTADYRPVDEQRYPGLTCVDTGVTALGVRRRAVLTHSPSLHAKQSRGFDQTLAKARRRLAELQARLARGKTRRDRDAVAAEITAICKPRWVNQVLTTTLTGTQRAELRLAWRTDSRARLEDRIFGNRILFTNRDRWSTCDVVAAYRSQNGVESGFRQMKDPHAVSFGPMHHWTELVRPKRLPVEQCLAVHERSETAGLRRATRHGPGQDQRAIATRTPSLTVSKRTLASEFTIRSATSAERGVVVVSVIVAHPAALAATSPLGASSTTRHKPGSTPRRCAASRNPSGSGLPRAIWSTVITTFGAAIPAALMRAWASSAVHDVTTAASSGPTPRRDSHAEEHEEGEDAPTGRGEDCAQHGRDCSARRLGIRGLLAVPNRSVMAAWVMVATRPPAR